MGNLPPPPQGYQLIPENLPPPPAGYKLVRDGGGQQQDQDRPRIFSDAEAASFLAERDAEAKAKGPVPPQTGNPDDIYEPGISQEERISRKQRLQAESQGSYDEQKAFEAGRTPLRRASDAATFALSAPVRAVTGGEKGFGDVVNTVAPEMGGQYKQQERDFVRANQGWLKPVAEIGELTLAIPPLASMGAPARGVAATLRTVADTNPAINRLIQPATSATGTAAQTYGPEMRLRDAAAFEQEGIPYFAPAFTSKGTARTARTIEEFPVLGGTVSVPKRETEMAMLARQQQIAREAGAAASPEDVGLVAQRGLDRYRTAKIQELERPVVEELGLPSVRPQPAGTTGTVQIDRPSQLNTASMTPQELDTAAQSRVSFPRSERSTIDDMSPGDLEKIIGSPARDTSFATKQSALYKIADNASPELVMDAGTSSRNPNLIPTRDSAAVAQDLLGSEQAARIQGGVLEGRFGKLVTALSDTKQDFSIPALRAARTELGRALAEGNALDASLSRKQLKNLYESVTNDIERGLVAVAARARQAANAGKIDPAIAEQADRALYLTQRADRYTRASMERMDRFMNVLGANTLEQAGRRIASYMKENTQDVRSLEMMASALRPEEWRSVLGHVVGDLGRLTPGAKEAERIFSFERYATDWNKISQNERVRGVFRKALGEESLKSLDNLGLIAERMKRYETTRNYSGSGYAALGGAGLAGFLNPATLPFAILGAAGTGLTGKVLTSQTFARWVNNFNRTQLKVGSSVEATRINAQRNLGALVQMAAKEPDPEVRGAITAAVQSVMQQTASLARSPQDFNDGQKFTQEIERPAPSIPRMPAATPMLPSAPQNRLLGQQPPQKVELPEGSIPSMPTTGFRLPRKTNRLLGQDEESARP